MTSSHRNLEKICKEKTSSLRLLAKCFSIILLIVNKSTHKKGNEPPQVISTDYLLPFLVVEYGRGLKSMSVVMLLSNRETYLAV